MTKKSTSYSFTLWTIATLALPLAGCGGAVAPAQGRDAVATAQVGQVGDAAARGRLRLQPGLYQLLSGEAKANEVQTICITPSEARATNGTDAEIRTELEQGAVKAGCTLKGVTIRGPVIAYEQMCRGTLEKVEVTYHGTSLTMALTSPGMPRTTYEERRIGDCDRR